MVDKLSDFPWIYSDWITDPATSSPVIAKILKWIVPVSYPIYLIGIRKRNSVKNNLEKTVSLLNEISGILIAGK